WGRAPMKRKIPFVNPGILAGPDVTYASMPWSTACCSVLCSPLSMSVQPDKAREEIGVPSLALRARTTLGFYVTIPHPWTDAGGVPGACGLCQPSNKQYFGHFLSERGEQMWPQTG